MKILHTCYRYPLYSNGSYFSEYLDSLGDLGADNWLVSFRYPLDAKVPKVKNLKNIWLNKEECADKGQLDFIFKSFLLPFREDLKSIDLVNTVGPRGLPLAILLKVLYKKPVVCTIEMIQDPRLSLSNKIINELMMRVLGSPFVDRVVCWSDFHAKKYLKKQTIKDKLVVIRPGIEDIIDRIDKKAVSDIRAKYGKSVDLFITFVKPLYEPYGDSAISLLEALEAIRSDSGISYKVMLFFRGEAQEQKVRNHITARGIEEYVIESGFVKFDRVPNYIYSSDLVVLPYKFEATVSRSLLEALVLGKVVIATSTGEVSSIIKDGKTGFLTDGSIPSLVSALKKILSMNRSDLKRISQDARKFVLENLSQSERASETLEVFESLI